MGRATPERMSRAAVGRAALLAMVAWLAYASPALAQTGPRILAASSLSDVMESAAARYHRSTGRPAPVLSIGASSRLVRQMQAGAPADLVLTADEEWMDVLERAELIHASTRRPLLRNSLVVVVPAGRVSRPADAEALLSEAFGRVAVAGAPVPAGRRAVEALTHGGVLDALRPKLVESTSARAALALAARDEVDAAIVYRTDALANDAVELAFAFPEEEHGPIVYPVALTPTGAQNPEARAFMDFLFGHEARAIFDEAGFLSVEAPSAADAPAASTGGAERASSEAGVGPIPLSLFVAALSLLLSILPALALGWWMARHEFVGKTLVSTFLLTPLVLPPVVTGYLLLSLFGRNGVFAPALEMVGWEVAFTRWGAVVASAVVGFPLLILMTRLAIESVDPRYEELAQTLGCRPLEAFLKVTVPMAAPGLAAGAVLAFARGLGEFGATAVLAGDVAGETRTLSLAVYALYEQPGGEDEASRLVYASLALCLLALFGYERLSRLQKRRIADQRT